MRIYVASGYRTSLPTFTKFEYSYVFIQTKNSWELNQVQITSCQPKN